MSDILNSLNAHNLLIFQPILMILVSKFIIYRALSDKTYLSLGLLSPLMLYNHTKIMNSVYLRNCTVWYTNTLQIIRFNQTPFFFYIIA